LKGFSRAARARRGEKKRLRVVEGRMVRMLVIEAGMSWSICDCMQVKERKARRQKSVIDA